MCKDGLLVDPTNISAILDMVAPTLVWDMRTMLGHIGYYQQFIRNYAQIVASLENLLSMDTKYEWTP